MHKRITSYTIHETGEGTRTTFTYSVLDDNGGLVKENARHTVILLDEDMLKKAKEIKDYLFEKIPE